MSDGRQNEQQRFSAGQHTPTTTTTTEIAGSLLTPIPAASTTQVLSFPFNNAAIFASPSQIISNTQAVVSPHLPLSFVGPSGQIFLSPTLPLSSSLPFISHACLVPQSTLGTRQFANFSLPFLSPAFSSPSSSSSSSSFQQPVPLSITKVESPSFLRQGPEHIKSAPPLTTSQATTSRAVSTKKEYLSEKTHPNAPPLPTVLGRSPVQHHLSHEPSTSAQPTDPISPPSPTHMTVGTIDETQQSPSSQTERAEVGTGSLKKLLTSDRDDPTHEKLRERLAGEPELSLFYDCFSSSPQSEHLHIELVSSQGDLKWLQVRQREFHIDPELGPVVVARVLISSNRIVKLQLLFPVYKTMSTRLFSENETESVLSELSLDHVICPGLSNYADKYSVLGYHPSHVRVFESAHVKRYDHKHCPIWHVPTGTFSKRDRTAQKMCKQCKYLQNSVVRLTTKACEVDPAERESWTNPSSNRPLAYMSAADREERYRKLRQERNQMLVKLRAYEERLGIAGGEGQSKVLVCSKAETCGVQEHLVSVSELPDPEEYEEGGEGGSEREGERASGEVPGEMSSGSEGGEGEIWEEGEGKSGATATDTESVDTGDKRRSSIGVGKQGERPAKRAKSTTS